MDSLTWALGLGYDYFAHSFLEGPLRPPESVTEAWLEELSHFDAGVSSDIAELIRSLDRAEDVEVANNEFNNCMVVPVPGRYVPPYASVFLDPARTLWGAVTSQVLSWYDQAGLDWVGQSSRYPWLRAPDYIGVEFAFVGELLSSLSAGSEIELDAGHLVILEHMREWVPKYVIEMEQRVTTAYWRKMAEVLNCWVHIDPLALWQGGLSSN